MTQIDAIRIGWMFYYAWMAMADPFEYWNTDGRHDVASDITWEQALDVGIAVTGAMGNVGDCREVHVIIQEESIKVCA